MAGSIVIDLFSTLDGVVQAPGGPEEDRDGGFAYGGWQAPLLDQTVGARVGSGIARTFDAVPKYVVSRGAPDLSWRGSQQLGEDLRSEVAALRERHRSTHVIGSAALARTLVRERLFDVLNLWVYPVVLGPGKRLFPEQGPALGLTLLEPPVASEKGAVLLRYGPDGDVTTGDMSAAEEPGSGREQ